MNKAFINFENDTKALSTDSHLIKESVLEEVLEQDYTPTAGHGKCKSCGCSGYRPSSNTGYCKCEHSFYQHEGSNW